MGACFALAHWRRKPQLTMCAQQIDRLKSPNVDLRRNAADALAKFGDPRATQPLIAALSDPDPQVRADAATGLDAARSPAGVDALIALINDPDETVSTSAIMALGKSQNPRAIAPLVASLSNFPTASSVLAQFGPAAVEPLLSAVKSDDLAVRGGAIEALLLANDSRAIPAFTAAINDPETGVRQLALFALQTLKAPNFPDVLRAALKDPDAAIRANALRASGQLPTAESIPSCDCRDARFRSQHPERRCQYLTPAQTADPQVAALLIALVQDPDGSVSWGALNTLATSRNPIAIDAMLGFAQGKNPKVDPHLALAFLAKVQDPRFFKLLVDSLASSDIQSAMTRGRATRQSPRRACCSGAGCGS